eukprot:Skav203606  [mRNA]  locus=scaffold935:358599:363133:+ [translate_table: standard]
MEADWLEYPLEDGATVSLLLEVISFDATQTSHVLRTTLNGTMVRFRGVLPTDRTVVLVTHAIVHTHGPGQMSELVPSQHTQVIARPYVDMQHITEVVEVCSGMGCLGQGLEAAGFDVALRTDCNGTMIQLASRLSPAEACMSDVCSDQILLDVSSRAPKAGTAAAGVPCQPYSRLGDKQAQSDVRSQPLLFFLRMSFLLRFSIIIIECVSEAFNCSWFQHVLTTFCKRTRFLLKQSVLQLQSVWPARRTRLWVTLTHPMIGPCEVGPLPTVQPTPLVSHVLDCYLHLPESELRQLSLDLYELRRFDEVGFDTNRLHWNRQMQTSLHSCGNQLTGCPCGCRQFPFTEARLATGQSWGTHLKHVLCALGQLASPIHSLWVGAHIVQQLRDRKLISKDAPVPAQILLDYMTKLLQSRDAVFGSPTKPNTLQFQQMVQNREFVMPTYQTPDAPPPTTVLISQSGGADHADAASAPESKDSVANESPVESGLPMPKFAQVLTHIVSSTPDHSPAPFLTGGVSGFENKRRRTRSPEAEVVTGELPSAELSSQEQRALLQDAHTPSPAKSNPPEQLDEPKPDDEEAKSLYVQIRHPADATTQSTRVSPGTTAGQLTIAEDKLGSLPQPINPRTWTNTFVPLTQPLDDLPECHLTTTFTEQIPCPFAVDGPTPSICMPTTREQALAQQQGWVAWDEMNYYLQYLTCDDMALPIEVRSFTSSTSAIEHTPGWLRDIIEANMPMQFATAYMYKNHWIPILVSIGQGANEVFTTPDDCGVADELVDPLGQPAQITKAPLKHVFVADCGFQSLAWLICMAQRQEVEPLLEHKAHAWRKSFHAHLVNEGLHNIRIEELILGGMQADPMYQPLSELLTHHGVFPSQVHERTGQVLQAIGSHRIAGILKSKRAWADLKAAANQVKPPVRLISQPELEAQIASRTQHRKSIGRKPNKPPPKQDPGGNPTMIKASDLTIPDGVFCQQGGPPLKSIKPDQVGPTACGVLILDQQDAEATLKLQRPVTPHALALIVIASPVNQTVHSNPVIRFPAMCNSTQEPVLVAGYMYQLGAQQVCRQESPNKLAVEERPAEAIRIVVFQDQAGELWTNMKDSPVKAVLQADDVLRPVNGASPVLDVWDRQWMTKRFEKVKSSQADLFTCLVRIDATLVETILTKSGQQGVYYEPRSICGRFPSNSHHVTWLPNMTYQEAKYALQTAPHKVSLVRHGERYGLRSDTINALQVHTKFRADTPMLLGATKTLYALGPLPFSTSKEAVAKLLKAWDWDARPLQPRGRSADHSGITWTIQAVEEPSHWIFSLQRGDVLITKIQPTTKPVSPNAQFSIVASRKTMDHLRQNEDDPMLSNDPWLPAAQKSRAQAAAASSVTSTQLVQLEASLEQKMKKAIEERAPATLAEDVPMEPVMESRLAAVEQHLQQLQQSQVNTDQKVNQLQAQIDHQTQKFGEVMDTKMAEQMERLEALLGTE